MQKFLSLIISVADYVYHLEQNFSFWIQFTVVLLFTTFYSRHLLLSYKLAGENSEKVISLSELKILLKKKA